MGAVLELRRWFRWSSSLAKNLELASSASIDVSGGYNGGAGGRIYFEAESSIQNLGFNNLFSNGGDGAVMGTGGSVRYLRPTDLAALDFQTGTLTIDTDTAIISHSNGSVAYGEISDYFYNDENGAFWPYSVCRFPFTSIRLGGSLVVRLQGSNALLLEAVSGDLVLGANLRADGGASNLENGGVAMLGGFDGVNSGELSEIRVPLHTLRL